MLQLVLLELQNASATLLVVATAAPGATGGSRNVPRRCNCCFCCWCDEQFMLRATHFRKLIYFTRLGHVAMATVDDTMSDAETDSFVRREEKRDTPIEGLHSPSSTAVRRSVRQHSSAKSIDRVEMEDDSPSQFELTTKSIPTTCWGHE